MHIIDILENLLKKQCNEIVEWFNELEGNKTPCFYSSVDLRYSGYKLAPVDTNLFPAGFNNLADRGKKKATELADNFFSSYFKDISKILIIAEDYSRNLYYLDNLITLKEVLEDTGKLVEVAIVREEISKENIKLESASKGSITLYTVKKNDVGYLLTSNGFIPDIIILNNDLTNGIPKILQEVKQPIIPSMHLGWHNRRKSRYFDYYHKLLQNFCDTFNIDSFLMQSLFKKCTNLDFKHKDGLELLAEQTNILLSEIKEKYKFYNIKDEPYIFIKADQGTYGRGIIIVRSADEVLHMNKKHRHSMNIIKDGIHNTQVILQEGIKTVETVNGNAAEPLIYLVNNTPVENIYRVNREHNQFNNLNSPGMYFVNNHIPEYINSLYLVAKLANIAAIYEASENNISFVK
ncbi:Glutamate-cysteine ligase [Rickettsiales bacterium Ac37b]|nr:Glutamate-cysteine ligase [Rickettsiales bacterium Ac37b]